MPFSDIKHSEDLKLTFGVAGRYNDVTNSTTLARQNEIHVTGDATLKYQGLGGHAAFFYKSTNPEAAGASTTEDTGILAQLGYMVVKSHVEAAARFAQVYADGGNNTAEYTVGFNFYPHKGHYGAKLQLDYSALTEENGIAAGDDSLDHRLRLQLQIKI